MARDAIRHLPPGTPESEVERLLGKPDSVEQTEILTASRPARAVRTWSYSLASGSYYDSTFLWVHVDGDGRVVKEVIGGG